MQSGPDRYQFHDLLRAYAADQVQHLEEAENRDAALARLFDWYLHTADSAAAILYPQWARIQLEPTFSDMTPLPIANYDEALRWYEAEQENIAAVTRTAVDRRIDQVAWKLPAVLRQIYLDRNPPGDWLAIGEIGLEAARRAGERYGEALILEALGRATRSSGRLMEALDFHSAAISIWGDLGDQYGRARSLNNLALTDIAMRRYGEAHAQLALAWDLSTGIGDRRHVGIVAMNQGRVLLLQQDFRRSLEVLQGTLPVLHAHGHKLHESACLIYIAEAESALGRSAEALNVAEEALKLVRQLDNKPFEAQHLMKYARIQRANDQHSDALVSYQRSATIHRDLGDRNHEASALDGTGETYQEIGQSDLAIDFHRQAVAILRESGERWMLARALDNLAAVLERTRDTAAAETAWREALILIADFPDPRAAELRASIEGKINAP